MQGRVLRDAVNFSVGGYYDRSAACAADQGGLFVIQYPLTALVVGRMPAIINNRSAQPCGVRPGDDRPRQGRECYAGLSLTGGLRHTWDETSELYADSDVLPVTSGAAQVRIHEL